MMNLPNGYDNWKLASPEDDIQPSDLVLTTQCDICGLHDHDEHIIVVGEENLCKDCVEVEAIPDDHYIQCEGCGVKVLEDEATPINDGSTDHTPKVCAECAR